MNKIEIVSPDDRTTMPYLTKFEKTKIIGVRMQQISSGAVPLVSTEDLSNTEEIVLKELEERCIPLTIKRPLPNGKYELWKLDELIY